MHLKYIELVNYSLFVLHILGRALLILSGHLTTQCGYTYSARLVKLLCLSHGVAAVSLWGGSTIVMSVASAVQTFTNKIEVATGIVPRGTSYKFSIEWLLRVPDLGYLIADFYSSAFLHTFQ
jgi:hypothetical protein